MTWILGIVTIAPKLAFPAPHRSLRRLSRFGDSVTSDMVQRTSATLQRTVPALSQALDARHQEHGSESSRVWWFEADHASTPDEDEAQP